MKKISLLLALSFFVHYGIAQFYTMPLNYPHDGSIHSANVMSIVDANTLWVGTQRFNTLTNYLPYPFAVKTTDKGHNWQFLPIDVSGSPFIVDVEAWDANVCYYMFVDSNVGGGQIWKTIDGGLTWTKKTSTQFVGGFADFIHIFSQDTIVAVGDPTSGYFEIQVSNDGGSTWSRVSQNDIPPILSGEQAVGGESYSAIGNTIWFGTSKGRCFKSVDRGNHWTATSVHSGSVLPIWRVCFTDALNGIFYLSRGIPAYYYLTNDGGETWNPQQILSRFWVTYSISRVDGINGGFIVSAIDTTSNYETSIFYTNNYFNSLSKIDSVLNSTGYVYFKDATTGWLSGNFQNDSNIYIFNDVLTNVSKKEQISEKLQIIPNPSNQNALITFPPSCVAQKKLIRIFDSSGKLIQEFSVDQDERSINVKTSSYSNGVYTIEVFTNHGFVRNGRWIICH